MLCRSFINSNLTLRLQIVETWLGFVLCVGKIVIFDISSLLNFRKIVYSFQIPMNPEYLNHHVLWIVESCLGVVLGVLVEDYGTVCWILSDSCVLRVDTRVHRDNRNVVLLMGSILLKSNCLWVRDSLYVHCTQRNGGEGTWGLWQLDGCSRVSLMWAKKL